MQNFVVTDDVLLFKKPKAGADAYRMIEEGEEVEGTGERVVDQTNGVNESVWVFVGVVYDGRKGYVLENRLQEIQVEKKKGKEKE